MLFRAPGLSESIICHGGDHGSDVTVLQNQSSALPGFPDGERIGRGEWIRTTDLLVPNQKLNVFSKTSQMAQWFLTIAQRC
jgi:hypothetical protein